MPRRAVRRGGLQGVQRGRREAEVRRLPHAQRLVGRLHFATEYRLGHLITLVHRLLDQRVADQRAEDVEARDVGLIPPIDDRHRVGVGARELNADTFQEVFSYNVGSMIKAPPMTFLSGGKQYVAVYAGGKPTPAEINIRPELKHYYQSSMLYVFGL